MSIFARRSWAIPLARRGSRAAGMAALALAATLVVSGTAGASSPVIWKTLLSSKAGSFSALAAAPSGGVFTVIGQYPFPLIRRYSATGAVLWSKKFSGSYWVGANDIASDASGAYVAAYDADIEHRNGQEMLLRKYLNNGTVAWTARWGMVDFDEQVRSVAVRAGVVYAFYDGKSYAVSIARFDAGTGQRIAGGDWDIPFTYVDSPMSAASIAVNDLGITVLMGGVPYAGSSPVILLKRLNFSGSVSWTRRIGSGTDGFDATSVALDSQGIVLAYQPESHNAHPRVARYTLAGARVWDRALPGFASAPAAGDGTSVYALYSTPYKPSDPGSFGIRRFSLAGAKQADLAVGTPKDDVPNSILPSGSSLYVGGASGEFSFFPLLMKVRKPAAH
jgi:hypothetical protein